MGKEKEMPREQLQKECWPNGPRLLGRLVHNFNPVGWKQDEEKTIDFLDDTTKLKMIFKIRWKNFIQMDKDVAIYRINDLIKQGIAEYLPGNKDGFIVDHDDKDPCTVMALFNMDGTYYVQFGIVTEIFIRPFGKDEPREHRRCAPDAPVRA